ncbi:Mariner Mos1 transposase, partial [Acromyrmex echinatior]
MSNFVLTKQHLPEVLIFCFNWKKSAAEAHRMLVEIYGGTASTDKSCREWFRRFKDRDFSVEDKPRSGQPKKFKDKELEALLEENQTQILKELSQQLKVDKSTILQRLQAMGKIQKEEKWQPHELTENAIANRLNISISLFAKHNKKSFLWRIVTGDEKWIFFNNPNAK